MATRRIASVCDEMAAAGEVTLEMNSPQKLKTMFQDLFEKEYYSSLGKFFNIQKRVGLHIRLEAAQAKTTGGTSKTVDLEERILEVVSNSQGPFSTLVVGDSGTGKSWLALNLTKELYDSKKPEFQNKIPLYIPLGRVEKMIDKQTAHKSSYKSDILFCYIMNHRNDFPALIYKGQLENLYLDLCACDLILILDGYDEFKVESDWWEHYRWMESQDFKDIPRIVSCRPSTLVGVDVSKMFGFKEEPPCTYVISPLENIVVEKYISQVPQFLCSIEYDSTVNHPWMMTKSITKDYPKWECAEENSEYKHWFLDRLPELQGLAQNVFVLTMICQLLPNIVEAERIASEDEEVTEEFIRKLQKEICRTEVLMYDRFTETWFKYQVKRRMESSGHAHSLYKYRGTLHHYMGGYAKNLAMRCAQVNRGMLSNGEISEGETLFWNLWTPWSPSSKKFRENESVEKQLFPQDENDTDGDRQGNLKFLRDSCLLRYDSGAKLFGFLHLSLFEYFLSREVFEKYRAALNYYANWNRSREGLYFLINQNNIDDPDFSGVLSMLVGRAEADETFQATLIEVIETSATLPGIEQMASNALTILNLSGYSFSGRNNEDDNFQNIQVPGANLRNSICGNSDFSGANFENAKLNQGWFQGCKFQGVNFSNCSFGQIPPINLQNFLVRDILCCTLDGFEHVIACCEEQSPTAANSQFYLKIYKFNKNFEFVEGESFFIKKSSERRKYIFSLVEFPSSIILFVFVRSDIDFLNENTTIEYPNSWYEFSSNSLVNHGKFEKTDLNLQYHFKVFNKRPSTQKCIMFFRNKVPEFFDMEELMSTYGKKRSWIKFIWIPFGPFKLLVSVYFGYVGEIDRRLDGNVNQVSLLHNGKPILCNDESVPLEIFWQFDRSDDNGLQEEFFFHHINVQSFGSYFDDNVILSFPSTANTYFFDLKNNKVLAILKNIFFNESISNDKTALYKNNPFPIALNQHKEAKKFVYLGTETNATRFVSKNFDFIALNNHESTDVFSYKKGALSQNVLKDRGTPNTFTCAGGNTYLVYVSNGSLHFEKLETTELAPKKKKRITQLLVAKYFSGDGSVCIVCDITRMANFFDVFKYANVAGGSGWKEVFDNRVPYISLHMKSDGVLITPRKFVAFQGCLYDPNISLGKPHLSGYDTESRQKFDIEGIPCDKMSKETEIFMFQEFQKIVFRNDKDFACYSVIENDKVGLKLVQDVTFINESKYPQFVFDPNIELSYIISINIEDNGYIGVWNLRKNYETLCVKDKEFVLPNTSLCTILLRSKIVQGYCINDTFLIKGSNQYSGLHEGSPIHVQSSSELGWIAAQFHNGDLVILDSRKLDTMFVFCGFQPGFKFQITLKSPKQVRIALVQFYAGEVVWLSINADSLRQNYKEEKLKEFKDWKVDASEVPSSNLSLSKVDISCSRSMDKRFWSLFEFDGSRSFPSEGDAYKPFCNLFLPVTEYQSSILITSDNQQLIPLTQKWIVTVIAKKSEFKQLHKTLHSSTEQHAALIIEGILHGGHFVIRAELTREDEVVKIKCKSCRGKSLYEALVKKYFGKQFEVDPEAGMKLLKNIWVDTYNPQWEYNWLYHNCNSWCKEKLQVLDIENEFKSKSYNFFVDLPHDFELKEFKFSK